MSMKGGLPYINLHPYTDDEWDNFPHVILTGDMDWDPGVLDCNFEDSETWHDALSKPSMALPNPWFDEFGDYCKHIIVQEHCHDAKDWTCVDTVANDCARFHTCFAHTLDAALVDPAVPTCDDPHEGTTDAHQTTKQPLDYAALCPMVRWLSEDIIKSTFKVTTQYACLPMSTLLKKHYKSPFLVLNVH